MELAVPAIRRHRQEAMMYVWLKALPDDAIRRSPVLSVFYGSMLLASGDPDAVEPRLEDAERALAAVPDGEALPWADTEDLRMLPATIAIYRASLAQSRGDAAGTAEHARRALDRLPPGRVMWEYNRDYERFGTPRTLENVRSLVEAGDREALEARARAVRLTPRATRRGARRAPPDLALDRAVVVADVEGVQIDHGDPCQRWCHRQCSFHDRQILGR
jgi:hypothetical protein